MFMYLFQSPTQARVVTGAALLSLLLLAPPAKRFVKTKRRRQLSAGLFVIALFAFVLFPRHSERMSEVFILAGQSNMAGRGALVRITNPDGVTYTNVFRPSSHEERLLSSGEYDFAARFNADLEFERNAKEPLHFDIDSTKTCGIGPGLVFARELVHVHRLPPRIGLVPCAVGGTKMTEWARDQALYQSMILRANVARRKSDVRALSGMLWYQGESDALNENDANVYETRLFELIENVRRDLLEFDLPVILVAPFAQKKVLPYIDTVREAVFRVAARAKRVRVVDSKGLALQEDGLHLTSSAQVLLGKLLAETYLDLVRTS